MNNKSIRIALIERGLKQWQLAEILGNTDTHMSRLLRHELPFERQEEIVSIIKEHGAPQYENQNHTERI